MNRSARSPWIALGLAALVLVTASGCSTRTAPLSSHPAEPVTAPSEAPSSIATAETPVSASPATTPDPSPTPVPTSAPTPAPTKPLSDPIAVKVYLAQFSGDAEAPRLIAVHRWVDRTVAMGSAAMEALLAGPTEEERADALSLGTIGTEIPAGTMLLGLQVENGLATVDLSDAFVRGTGSDSELGRWAFRLAQVTYTLTQFPTVESVAFRVAGRPVKAIEGHEGTEQAFVTRSHYFDQLAAIFVDDPAWNAAVGDSFTVRGRAQVLTYPSQFEAALVDAKSGDILAHQVVQAACKDDCWLPPGGGEFSFTVTVPADADRSNLRLRVWAPSQDEDHVAYLGEYPIR